MIDSIKTTIFHIFLLGIFGLFLFFPLPTLNGAASGLLLWYNILLPTLLPFIMLTSIIIKTQAFSLISKFIGPTLGRIFRVSDSGSLAIIIGFLCGYPMGAKVIGDLYDNGNVSQREAQYLLSFCNNTSPMFIVSFFVLQILGDTTKLLPVLLALYLAPITLSLFTRIWYSSSYRIKYTHEKTSSEKNSEKNSEKKLNQRFSFQLLDEVIIESITLILKIGGYIMLFSILISLSNTLLISIFPKLTYIIPMLEITNGLAMYQNMETSTLQYLCMIFLISFGGFCAVGQTQCVLTSPDIKISHYFAQKIITAMIAVIISILYIQFFS